MNVVIVGTRGFPNVQGGIERHCEYLAIELVKLNCQVTVLTRAPYVNHQLHEYQGIKLIALPAIRKPALETLLHTFIAVWVAAWLKPDLIHIHAVGPGLFVPLARLLGLKVVFTSHGPDYKRKKWGKLAQTVLKLGERWGIRYSQQVITIADNLALAIKQHYQKPVTVIPNGVPRPNLSQATDKLQEFGLSPNQYLLSVGRFVPEKGFHDLLVAYQAVPALNKKVKLVIAGAADHHSPYSQQLIKNSENNSQIILTGYLKESELAQLYAHARAFILPSYYEGLPISLLEALSYGLPCAISDIPAHRQLKLAQSPINYFKPGNLTELKTSLTRSSEQFHNCQTKHKISEQVMETYSWEKIAARTKLVYKQVLNN